MKWMPSLMSSAYGYIEVSFKNRQYGIFKVGSGREYHLSKYKTLYLTEAWRICDKMGKDEDQTTPSYISQPLQTLSSLTTLLQEIIRS